MLPLTTHALIMLFCDHDNCMQQNTYNLSLSTLATVCTTD